MRKFEIVDCPCNGKAKCQRCRGQGKLYVAPWSPLHPENRNHERSEEDEPQEVSSRLHEEKRREEGELHAAETKRRLPPLI